MILAEQAEAGASDTADAISAWNMTAPKGPQ